VFSLSSVNTLKLNGFDWCHRKEDFDFIWEFSRLSYLSFSEIDLVRFLEHPSFNELGQLQVLRIGGDYRAHDESYLENVWSPLDRLLNTLNSYRDWDEMWKGFLTISSFAKDKSQPKHLEAGGTAQAEQMDPGHLVLVAKHCVHLTDLVLKFDVNSLEVATFPISVQGLGFPDKLTSWDSSLTFCPAQRNSEICSPYIFMLTTH